MNSENSVITNSMKTRGCGLNSANSPSIHLRVFSQLFLGIILKDEFRGKEEKKKRYSRYRIKIQFDNVKIVLNKKST